MKILEMTASFGCLDRQTLRLSDGVNVMTLPNESGKSTWTAFLVAMFYGIDTAQRAAKGRIPARLRYQPWSGAPMEGTLTLERDGRRLVLQRTSQKGRPMGLFRAYDPDTGLDVPELTADNCGLVLLGAEKEVFLRTALLSGGELAVTDEEDLARRLSNLASSGDTGENYPAAAQRLKAWKNRLRSHNRGLIPEAEARISANARLQADRAQLLDRKEHLQSEIGTIKQAERPVLREKNALLPLLLMPVYLAVAIVMAAMEQWPFTAVAGIAALLSIIIYYVNRKANKKAALLRQEAEKRAETLRAMETELAVTEARLQDIPQPSASAEGELEELLFREEALEQAMAALEQARDTLAQEYSPRLTAETAQVLKELTAGRYDGVVLDRSLSLQLRESETGLARPLAALSKGTQDAAWLSLRLAMTRLLLPKGAPMVLDDALLTFDEARTANVLELLRKDGRQVLVFGCRSF